MARGDDSRLERHERTGRRGEHSMEGEVRWRYGFARYLVDTLPRFLGLCTAVVGGSVMHGYSEPDLPLYRLRSAIMRSGKLVLICVILRA